MPNEPRDRDCTCLGTCRGAEGLGPRYRCALERTTDADDAGIPSSERGSVSSSAPHSDLVAPVSPGAGDDEAVLLEVRERLRFLMRPATDLMSASDLALMGRLLSLYEAQQLKLQTAEASLATVQQQVDAAIDVTEKHCRALHFQKTTPDTLAALLEAMCQTDARHVQELQQAQQKLATVQEGLRTYGRHLPTCESVRPRCECGHVGEQHGDTPALGTSCRKCVCRCFKEKWSSCTCGFSALGGVSLASPTEPEKAFTRVEDQRHGVSDVQDPRDSNEAPVNDSDERAPISNCEDCGLPYADFPLDVVLPDADWLAIHPTGDGGLLCGGCIARRAAKLPRMIVVYARLVADADHDAFRVLKNKTWPELSLAMATERDS